MRTNSFDPTIVDVARSASARLRHWLLQGPAQLGPGKHAGAIVGSFDEQGRPNYAYAEITGYYLLWLAGLDESVPANVIADRTARCLDWVRQAFTDDAIPPTRIPLQASPADWRNLAVFFFDIAMLLRGVAAARAHAAHQTVQELLRLLSEKSSLFVSDEALVAVRPHGDTYIPSLPMRWSTTPGPFLLKATATVELEQDLPTSAEPLRHACSTHAAHHRRIGGLTEDMLHPALYHAEGLLRYGAEEREVAAAILSRCLRLQREDGALPERFAHDSMSERTIYRNDVAAQALRIGMLLDGHASDNASRLGQLASLLSARVNERGEISFDSDASLSEPNTWTAMFTEQALRWYASPHSHHDKMHPWLLV